MNIRAGESLSEILYYWIPSSSLFILVALPPLFDAYLVAGQQSTAAYGASGMATNFLHTLVKLETVPVAAIAVIGRLNGAKKYTQCGQELNITTFWTTILLGATQLFILWCNRTISMAWCSR